MKEKHMQRQSKLASLGHEVSMKVNTLDMPQKIA